MKTLLRSIWTTAFVLVASATALADPITGMTYTYDLSQVDPFMGHTTTGHELADDVDDDSDLTRVTSLGRLTDGDPGPGPGNFPCCLFPNGRYAGFRNDGAGGAPKLKIDIDLGGTYTVHSFTYHYLVEDAPAIYSPQPIKNANGDILFNALTVSGSSDGETFNPLGFTNDFAPVFGPDGDAGTLAQEVRTATIPLGGVLASHLSIDIRTPWSFVFASEIVVDGDSSGPNGDYNEDGIVDAADYVVWRKSSSSTEEYDTWRVDFGESVGSGSANSLSRGVPEPTSIVATLCGWLLLVIAGVQRIRS